MDMETKYGEENNNHGVKKTWTWLERKKGQLEEECTKGIDIGDNGDLENKTMIN